MKGTPDGRSSQDIFLKWVKEVVVRETRPPSNHHKCIVLLVSGSKRHLSVELPTKMKEWGVEVVVRGGGGFST